MFKIFNVKFAFVLTDPMLKELEVIESPVKILEQEGIHYDLSTNVIPEPPLDIGDEVLEEIREKEPDLVIGIGGGSAIDLSKAAAVLADNEGSVAHHLNLTGSKQLKSSGIPTVLIPMTARTGVEVTDIAVFSLEDTKAVIIPQVSPC